MFGWLLGLWDNGGKPYPADIFEGQTVTVKEAEPVKLFT
jgi:hypothetical protein